MYRKSILTILILIFAALAACSPTAVEETVTEADTNEDVLQRVTEVADSEQIADSESEQEVQDKSSEEEIDEEVEQVPADSEDVGEKTDAVVSPGPIDQSLPKLPELANTGGGAGPGVGGGISAEAALDVEDPISGSLVIDPFNMFKGTEFVLAAELPQTPAGMIAVERTRSTMTAELARQIASNFQFTGALYQEQLPMQFIEDARIGADGTFVDMPFIAFSGDDQLVMTSGSLWINFGQPQISEQPFLNVAEFPEAELIGQVEALLASYSFIDFEYTLRSEPYGNVLVIPSYEGVSTNNPIMGFYFTLDQDKQSVLQSLYMDLYSQIDVIGDYPVQSAEAAWQSLKTGLENGAVNWYFSGGPIPVEPLPPVELDVQPRFWFPSPDVDTVTNLYGFPTVYNPVGEDGPPIILLDGILVQGPADIGMMMATSESGLFKFEGQYVAADVGSPTFLAQSVAPISYEDQLFIQGTVVREGDQLFIETVDQGRIQLNNAPADLPDGLELFVNGYRNGEAADGTPLLDWQYIDEVIDYGEEFPIVEPLPVDGPGFDEEGFATITIDKAELAYGISWPQVDEMSDEFQPIMSDFLIPIWRFSGTSADGAELTFEIPAVDQGYFAQN